MDLYLKTEPYYDELKVVGQIRKAPNDSIGRLALVAIQKLIKSKIPDKNDSELGILLKTAHMLLKYGN
tara:strand:+ start:11340 stop:11543 length:204 start_codon:yes stop_codon:yes gene_type:complete